jgi:hypothetical protein
MAGLAMLTFKISQLLNESTLPNALVQSMFLHAPKRLEIQ